MNRRNFLKLVSAVPFVGLIPVSAVSTINRYEPVDDSMFHSMTSGIPNNCGVTICKDVEQFNFGVSGTGRRINIHTNGSKHIFITASHISACDVMNLGWVAIAKEINSPSLVRRLSCRLRLKGVPHHMFEFTYDTCHEITPNQ